MRLTVHGARRLRNTRRMGRQDPYVVLILMPERLGGRTLKCYNGHCAPVWEQKHRNDIAIRVAKPVQEWRTMINRGTAFLVVEQWGSTSASTSRVGALSR